MGFKSQLCDRHISLHSVPAFDQPWITARHNKANCYGRVGAARITSEFFAEVAITRCWDDACGKAGMSDDFYIFFIFSLYPRGRGLTINVLLTGIAGPLYMGLPWYETLTLEMFYAVAAGDSFIKWWYNMKFTKVSKYSNIKIYHICEYFAISRFLLKSGCL